MELDDCAFPLLTEIVCTDDPAVAFKDADYALLVGARPRGPGMEGTAKIEAGEVGVKELETYILAQPEPVMPSGRQEMLENLINRYLDRV